MRRVFGQIVSVTNIVKQFLVPQRMRKNRESNFAPAIIFRNALSTSWIKDFVAN